MVGLPEGPRASTSSPREVREARERAIARLSEHFANDELELEELEARLSKAHQLETVEALSALFHDLPERQLTASPRHIPIASDARPSEMVFAVFSGARRRGTWTVARELRAVAVMGGVELDLREARLSAGVTTVRVFALMGGVEIVVPPGLAVEMHGAAIMGGFDHLDRAPAAPDPEAPVLRVEGMAVMGGVTVETRLPGERRRDARRRARRERRALGPGDGV